MLNIGYHGPRTETRRTITTDDLQQLIYRLTDRVERLEQIIDGHEERIETLENELCKRKSKRTP